MTSTEAGAPAAKPVAGGERRIERLFARLGLGLAALLLPLLVLALDVALSSALRPDVAPAGGARFTEVLNLNLVTHDGRPVGAASYGVELELSASVFYRNRPDQRIGAYRTNALGCRGPELDPERRRPRVVILGGSAAFGLRAVEEQTFAGLLAARHPQLEVINCGTVGYVSEQELGLFFFHLAELEPVAVIDFSGWNDLYTRYWLLTTGMSVDASYRSNAALPVMEDRLVRLRAIERRPASALRQLVRTAFDRSTLLGWLRRRGEPEFRPGTFGDAETDLAARTFAEQLARLERLATERGASFLAVLQPEVGQTLNAENLRVLQAQTPDYLPGDRYWLEFPPLYERFRRQAVAALGERGVEAVDASEHLRSRRLGPQLFLDPVHLNPAGHEQMTELLAGWIESAAGEP